MLKRWRGGKFWIGAILVVGGIFLFVTVVSGEDIGAPIAFLQDATNGLMEPGERHPDPPLRVTLTEMARTYKRNVLAWDAEYKDRELEIVGVVLSVRKESQFPDEFYGHVRLMDDDGTDIRYGGMGDRFFCTFTKDDWEEFAQLRRGHIVRMVGVGEGHAPGLGSITLRNCSGVEITGQYD